MPSDADRLLSSWSGSPTPAKAVALCDVLRASLSEDVSLRSRVVSIGPAIVGRHDGEPEVLLALGRLYLAAEELLRADAVLKRALELAPADARPLRLLGEVFLSAGNARDAEKAFEGAIARGLGDRETAAWLGRARSYVAVQDTGGASAVASAIARGLWSPDEAVAGAEGATRVQAPIEDEPTTSAPGLLSGGPALEAAIAHGGAPASLSDVDVTAQRPFKPDIAALARSGPSLPSPDSARTLVHPRPAGLEAPRPKPTLRSALHEDDEPEPPTAARPETGPPTPDVSSVLDEMSMQLDVLKWDGEKMPQSGRDMERYLDSLRSREGLVIDEVTRIGHAVEGVPPATPPSDEVARVMAMPAIQLPVLGLSGTIMMEGVRAPAQPNDVEMAPTDRQPPQPTPRMVGAPAIPRGGTVPMPHLVRSSFTEPMFGGLPPVPSVAVGAQSVQPSPPVSLGDAPPPAPVGPWSTPPLAVEVAVPRRAKPRSPLVPLLFAAVVVVVVALAVFYGWLRMRGGHGGAGPADGRADGAVARRAPID